MPKAKRKREPIRIDPTDLNAFVRIVLGRAAAFRESIIDRAARALKVVGFPKKHGYTDRDWINACEAVIQATIARWMEANPNSYIRKPGAVSVKTFPLPAKKKKTSRHSSNSKFYQPNTSDKYRKLSYDEANSPNFLESYEWRTLRMAVLEKYGKACMCCGATPNHGIGIYATVDHIISRRKRPDLALCFDNLQVTCNVCNHGKSNWSETDWRPKTGKTISAFYVDEPEEPEQDTEYVDMATVRILRDMRREDK